MKKFLTLSMLLLITMIVKAQEKKKNAVVQFEVNGICDMCKKRIEKAAFSVKGVKSAVWDIETHQLSLILNEQKTAVLDVKSAIAKIGHDTDEVKASNQEYDQLHSCCRYERK